MKLGISMIGGCILASMAMSAAPADAWVTIRNGEIWTDTDGGIYIQNRRKFIAR